MKTHSVPCDGEEPTLPLYRGVVLTYDVQPAHELAFIKLFKLLNDKAEIKATDAKFHAVNSSADKLSSEILELIDDNVEIRSFSRADNSLNCWDHAWQGVLAELTAIRHALQRKDTAGILLRKHFLTYPAILDSIREILTGLD